MANLPDGKTLGMGSGYGAFRRIAGQRIKNSAQQPKQPAARPRKGPSLVHQTMRDIAAQKVKLEGQQPRPKAPKYQGSKEEPKVVETAKKRFQEASVAEATIRKDALDDLKFRAGDQWDQQDENQRRSDGRPCLTINQIPQFVREVTNEQRQNRTSIKINPVDDQGDVETAEILQGLIRHIEYNSGADAAYDTAYQSAVTGGFGYWYVTTEYVDAMSFDQEIKIKRERNPFCIYIDPYATEPDRSDMRYAFRVEQWSKDEFKEKWPDAKLAQHDDWESIGDGGWSDKDSCRVVSYWWKETTEKTIALLSDGAVLLKEVLDEYFPEAEGGRPLPLGVRVVSERKTQIDVVKWAKINGMEILEETDWAGKYIPVVPVLGDEVVIDGDLTLEGVVRFAKDPQRQYNFMASATAEAIALAPKAPWVAAVGQIEGFEKLYANANRMNIAVLPYKPVTVNNTVAPPPQRQSFEPAIQATTAAMMQAANDLRATTGIYQAALGEPSNEKSGVAIQERAQQSQGANYHYADNLTRAIRYTGLIILDLIPHIYDAARVIRIIGEDGTQDVAHIGPQGTPAPEGVDRIYDLSIGKYDVTVSTGPSFQTRRQEAVAGMTDLVRAFPQMMEFAGDLIVRSTDIPYSEEIADRMAKMLPPQVQEADNTELPPQVQQMVSQLMDQNKQLTEHLQAAQDDLDKQQSAKAMELESKERIEFAKVAVEEQKNEIEWAKVQASLVTGLAKANAQEASEMAAREYDFINAELDRHHEAAMSSMEHQQSQEMADQQHQQGMEAAQQLAEQQPEPDATA